MNHGNFLESLLNTASVNPASGKTPAIKARTDASEKFRDAFDQVRPQAAASTAARNAGATERADTRNTIEPATRHLKNRPEAAPRESASAKKPPVKNDRPDAPKTNTTQAADTKASASKSPASKPVSKSDEPEAAVGTIENPLTKVVAEEPVITDPAALLSLVSGETELAVEDSAPIEDPALLAAVPPAQLMTPAMAGDVAEDGSIESLGLSGLATASAGETRGNALSSLGTNGQAAAGQSLTATTTEAALPGDDALAGDNPDFLLLGAKTATANPMDAKATAEPLLDAAKPAATPASPPESLVRMAEAQSPAARSFVVQTGVPVNVGQPQWSQAVGEKVLWLAAQNVSAAEIRLDPPDMGQLHVKVSVNQDQATVTFVSPHPAVREALDQQLNRLREMFSEQGLNLVNVDVSDRSGRQDQEAEGKHAGKQSELDDEELVPVASSSINSTRLVDHYA